MKRILALLFTFGLALAAAPAYGATHYITGTSGNDTIIVGLFGSIFGNVNGSQTLSLPASECNDDTVLRIYAYAGSDDITVVFPPNCDVTCRIYGGDEGDTISVVGCGDVVVHGNGGPDHFHLGTPSHYFNGIVYGEAGNDEFQDYYLEYSVLYGGSGNDAFSGNIRTFSLIYGGTSEDYFFGTPNEQEGQGVFVGNDDAGTPYSGDYFFGFPGVYFKTIYCDGTDELDPYAVVEKVSGNCD